jgi:hypothetical protein
MSANKLLTLAITAGLILAGCSGQDTLPSSASTGGGGVTGGEAGGPGGLGARTAGAGGGAVGEGIPFADAPPADRELLQNLIVYFEFDSSEIQSDFNAMLAAHGRYLAAHPEDSVRRAQGTGRPADSLAAGRVGLAAQHGKLWRGAPGCVRQRRGIVPPESSRRARLSIT